jgi:hypothetical protein
VQAGTATLQPQAQRRAGVAAAVTNAVGHQLGHEQADVAEEVIRHSAGQLAFHEPAGTRGGMGAARHIGLDGERLHTLRVPVTGLTVARKRPCCPGPDG